MKKLLSLLKKDAILVRRNKIWTMFEVIIPVVILLLPLFILEEKYLLTYKDQQEEKKSLKALTGLINEVELVEVVPDIDVAVDGCQVPPDLDLRIYEKYVGNHTRPDRKRFSKIVKNQARQCKPIGGVFVTSEGVDMIVPATSNKINDLKKPIVSTPERNTASFYASYIPYLYKAMSIKFRKDAEAMGFTPLSDRDRIKTIYIYSENEHSISFFGFMSVLIGLSITLPVINTPYLNSIGLSRTLFYAEHLIFATVKSVILILLVIVGYCILLTVISVSVLFNKCEFQRFNAFWLVFGVFVYIVASVSFAMFISAFFSKPRRAVEAMALIWILSIYFATFYYRPKGWKTIPYSLNLNQALSSYIKAIEPHFVKEDGMSFSDGFTSGRDDQYSCIVYLLIMVFDAVLFSVGSVFASKLVDKTSDYVVKMFWKRMRNVDQTEKTTSTAETSDAEGILLGEEVVNGRKNAVSDIELNALIKIYANGETAVNGLSMRAVRGQVSVLLGHNGCGKSTTFGMITGILQPTSGTITIEGVDAVENRKITRESVGYCPQYNPLYEKLTVMEHLRLVNTLKGKSSEGFQEDADNLLSQISMEDKKNVIAKNLSGGMKRKLSVCMAMIGGSRVVLLDEPTAGMDPGARLDVQKILNKVKDERTILLTTHYMDEAEKLGDWVFVMSHGKMAASGSLPFLKKKYGDGYVMTLVLDSDDNVEDSMPVVERLSTAFVNDAKIKDQRGQMIEISLPETQKDKFLSLFKAIEAIIDKQYDSEDLRYLSSDLTEQVKKMKIVAMGISVSSLEQVFIKIEKECDRVLYGIDDEEKRAKAEKNFNSLAEAKKEPPIEGSSLISLQLKTILYKRCIHLLRNPSQLIMQFLIPCFLLYLIFEKTAINPPADPTALISNFNLSGFPPSKVILQFEKAPDSRVTDYLKQFHQLEVHEVSIKKKVASLVKNQTITDKKIGLIISVFERRTIIHYHERTSSCLPIALNLLANLKYIRINSTTPVGNNTLYVEFVPMKAAQLTAVLTIGSSVKLYLLATLLSLVIIPAVLFLIEEKTTRFQHQQMLTGISPIVFWTGSIIWDHLLYLIVGVYMCILFFVFGTFSDYHHLIYLSLFLYFFAMVSVVYLVSVFIKTPSTGSTFLVFLRILTFVVGFGFYAYFLVLSKDSLLYIRKWYLFGLLDPGLVLMYALTKIDMCQARLRFAYYTARNFIFGFDSIYEFPAIWVDVSYLILLSVLFFWFFVAFRSRVFKRLLTGFKNAEPREKKRYTVVDEASTTKGESSQLVNLTGSAPSAPSVPATATSSESSAAQNGKPVVVAEQLVKDFGKLRAVNGLTVTVRERECFGLLGQNGAGKTTSFDMLTGLSIPSGGTATIAGEKITNRIQIGYCPQFDTLLGQFSGRQCLRIIAQLQGYSNCEEVIEMVLTCIGMTEHADKKIQHCSGGQKRKISVGIALMSRSPCVMLDEPTAGIDPRARREIWDILHNMREKGNSSIVLTSHSMDECEALCTRIGILREGDMIAVGSSQELKSKFGNFYLMTMVLQNLEQFKPVIEAVAEKWPDALLKTEPTQANLNIVFQIPKGKGSKWSETFKQCEELATLLEMEDFMLSQATLEDAFIRLNSV
ncbi:hypothetical protein CRE_26165 [Caenorhabditis remanei]|uniref:ABC transporter domain-containing protein n=1 Tax=Caenorhabditis remanei TaxID=31234 RepID=E3LQI6_CAERE|nr:hypothetical protein CRE_26165 [Caenorhabditis remanei]